MTIKEIFVEAVEKQVSQVIMNQLSVSIEAVTPDATLDDLGADSLDKIDIVMALEEIYEIEISEDDAAQCQTLQAITSMLVDGLEKN